MTGQQNTPPEITPTFGDIPINLEPQTLAGKPARSRRQPPRPAKQKSPILLLLSLAAAIAALYFAAVLLVVPMLIRGPAAEKLGHRLNRPVLIKEVSLSPFSFRLHLAGISIGPDLNRKGAVPLCTVTALQGRLLPTALLQGKVVLADVQITRPDMTLVRSPDSSPLELLRSSARNSVGKILPSWLLIQGLHLTDGTLNVQDQTNARLYTAQQIQLNLPRSSTNENISEPTLAAVVNASPVTLKGRSLRNSDGSTETRLNLQFKKIDLQQAVSYLPDTLAGLNVQSDNAAADLEIILKDTTSAGIKVIVIGTVNAANLSLQAADQAFSLTVPTMQMRIKARPLENHYAITSLTAVAPQLTLTSAQARLPGALQAILCNFLNSNTMGLTIEQLKIDQGTLTLPGNTRWHDLQLLLTNLSNGAAHRSDQSTALTLQAGRAKAAIAFQGEITPAQSLAGKLSLQNMDITQLQPFLSKSNTVRFDQGLLQLEGTLLLTQLDTPDRQGWKLTDSSLRISDFSLQKQGQPWAAGKEIRGAECLLQADSSGINCQEIDFEQTDFAQAGSSLFALNDMDSRDGPGFLSYDMLKIFNSSADLPLLPQMRLTKLQLQLSGIKQSNPGPENLRMKAVLGARGTLDITGKLQRSGQGVLQLSASNIDVNALPRSLFADWLSPEVRQGTVQLDGRLKIPDLRFAGSLQINDFAAGSDSAPALRWQQAAASDITAKLAPFAATVGRLILEQPSITLPGGEGKLPKSLLTLLKPSSDGPTLPPLNINECVINRGSLSSAAGPAERFNLTNIEGTIAPLQKDTPAEFTLSGQADRAYWTTTGRADLQGRGEHRLQITDFSFPPAVQALYADSLQLDVSEASANLTVATTEPGTIQLTGTSPLPGSDLALLLALLTDQDRTISLLLPAVNNTDPVDVLTKVVSGLLGRLRLQAAVSPGLVLHTMLPELNLAGTVEFLPGQTIPDFMDGLEDYAVVLAQRPQLALAVRGNFDETVDSRELLQVLQEEADAQLALENIRREQRRAQLVIAQQELANKQNPPPGSRLRLQEQLADLQPLPQTTVQVPPDALLNLARQRAEVLRSFLLNTLHIPEEKIQLLPSAARGSKADLVLLPDWPTAP